MKLQTLVQQLEAAGLQTVQLGHGGAAIVVTPHGGRIMGVFTHPQAENAFFVNPEFANADAAKKTEPAKKAAEAPDFFSLAGGFPSFSRYPGKCGMCGNIGPISTAQRLTWA